MIQRRREVALIYDQFLNDLDELKLPEPPSKNSDHFDVFQNYEIEAKNRDKLKNYLLQNGIGTLYNEGVKEFIIFKTLDLNQVYPKLTIFLKIVLCYQ